MVNTPPSVPPSGNIFDVLELPWEVDAEDAPEDFQFPQLEQPEWVRNMRDFSIARPQHTEEDIKKFRQMRKKQARKVGGNRREVFPESDTEDNEQQKDDQATEATPVDETSQTVQGHLDMACDDDEDDVGTRQIESLADAQTEQDTSGIDVAIPSTGKRKASDDPKNMPSGRSTRPFLHDEQTNLPEEEA